MKFGIIGGSGLYDLEGIQNLKKINISTPFGKPSDEFISGESDGAELVFLPRHGQGHRILPGEINHKANIFAMKKLGVTHIISVSAVGSLTEKMRPRDIVLTNQYFDRTKKGSEHTFFGNGIAGHISFADPVCPELHKIIYAAAKKAVNEISGKKRRPRVHKSGTYINMEGPAFSTKVESRVYRKWGMDVIGMTNLGEAKLSREAEICYCTVAMVTDYDCWHPGHDHVTVGMIIQNLIANVHLAKNIVKNVLGMKDKIKEKCPCRSALSTAIITSKEAVSQDIRKKLNPIIGKYF